MRTYYVSAFKAHRLPFDGCLKVRADSIPDARARFRRGEGVEMPYKPKSLEEVGDHERRRQRGELGPDPDPEYAYDRQAARHARQMYEVWINDD